MPDKRVNGELGMLASLNVCKLVSEVGDGNLAQIRLSQSQFPKVSLLEQDILVRNVECVTDQQVTDKIFENRRIAIPCRNGNIGGLLTRLRHLDDRDD